MRFPQRDCRGMTKREMVGKDMSAVLGGRVDDEDDDRSDVVRMDASGTWWIILGPEEFQSCLDAGGSV
jgi:hypothetical protein